MSKITPRLSSVTSLLADSFAPLERHSDWYCDNPLCDGKPHPGWELKHARAAQRPPDSDWFIWLLCSGRGFGKSLTATQWLLREVERHPRTEWAVVAPTGGDVAKCFEDLSVGILSVAAAAGITIKYNKTEHDGAMPNGSMLHGISADKPDRLRGYNLAGAWCDELSSWRYPDAWNLGLLPALRDRRVSPKVVVTTTPKPVTLLRQLLEEDPDQKKGKIIVTRGATFDNADNLAPEFIEQMKARYEGTRRGRQELYGEMLTDVEGALVDQDMIDQARISLDKWHDPQDRHILLMRTVVAIDPATTSGENSDETGIIVCARGIDGRGYILEDGSCKKTPDGWAKVACALYEKWGADRIIAEKNQGGDMVERIVRSVNPNVAYRGVAAKVGKKLRAEPIAALYEQGKVSHVGYFEELEDQWTTWVPDMAAHQKSPDRVDALVHGLTELGLIGLPGVEFSEAMELGHPACYKCGKRAPAGTPVCARCGAERPIPSSAPSEPAVEDPWSLTSGMGPQAVRPDQYATQVQQMLRDMGGEAKWWDRRR